MTQEGKAHGLFGLGFTLAIAGFSGLASGRFNYWRVTSGKFPGIDFLGELAQILIASFVVVLVVGYIFVKADRIVRPTTSK